MSRHELVLALKVLWRRKFFTFVSLFGIALTLGVLTVVAALFEHAFGDRAPETKGDRSLAIYQLEVYGERVEERTEPGYEFLDRWVRDLPGTEAVSLVGVPQNTATYLDGEKISLRLQRADVELWRVLDFEFLEGRPFDEIEARGERVAVLDREIRRRVFGAGPALGRSIEIGRERFRVVGVVENPSPFRRLVNADVWVPIAAEDASGGGDLLGGFRAILLAPSPRDLPAVRAEVRSRLDQVDLAAHDAIALGLAAETPFELWARQVLGGGAFSARHRTDGRGERVDHAARLRGLLVLGALLFMALPSLNLVNLSISRILERASEIGVRKSFGASTRRLVGQLLVENLVLTLLGGLIALPLAAFVLHLVSGTALVDYGNLSMGWRTYVAGFVLALVFGLLSGAYPAWRMSRLHPVQALKETAR